MSSHQETVMQAQAWTVVMGAALQEQARAVSFAFHSGPVCSISRGPKLAIFEDGETLPSPHFLVDAQLEGKKEIFGGTFLLPSIKPEGGPENYAAIRDDSTGITHVALKGTVVYQDVAKSSPKGRPITQRWLYKKETAPQVNPVEMPKWFDALPKAAYANMPRFGNLDAASSSSSSISILDSFSHICGSSQSSSVVGSTSDSFPGNIDSAIVAIGRPLQQVLHVATTNSLGAISSTHSRESANSTFFRSLLNKGKSAQTVSPTIISSSSSFDSANALFFQSLLADDSTVQTISGVPRSSQPCANSANLAYFRSLLTEESTAGQGPSVSAGEISKVDSADTSLITTVDEAGTPFGHSELANTTTFNTLVNASTATSWPSLEANDMSENSSALDLAVTHSVSQPRPLLSELNLAVTQDQVELFSQDDDNLQNFRDNSPGSSTGCREGGEVRMYRPHAPRQDAMSYEDYSLSSSCISSDHSEILSMEAEAELSPTTTPLRLNLDNQMHHQLVQEPLEEALWTGLNESFHNSQAPPPADNDNFEETMAFSQSVANIEETGTFVPTLKLPSIDRRKAQPLSGTHDVSELPVNPSSRDSMAAATAEMEGSGLRIRVPGPPLGLLCLETDEHEKKPSVDLQAATQNLDLDDYHEGPLPDWSVEADRGDEEQRVASADIPASGAQAESEDAIAVGIELPLITCYRLPTSIIRDICLEQSRIWDSEGPWMSGDEDKTYEIAVKNVRLVHGKLPPRILFWTKEFNGAFVRLGGAEKKSGTAWEIDSQQEQIRALATFNVEWDYFSYCLRRLPKEVPLTTTFKAAESPKNWIWKTLGCTIKQFETLASDGDEILSTNADDDTLNGDPPTRMTISSWDRWASKLKHLFDVDNPHGLTAASPAPVSRQLPASSLPASSLVHVTSVNDCALEDIEDAMELSAAVVDVTNTSASAGYDAISEVAAPVTPALLLRLPNRADKAEEQALEGHDGMSELAAPVTPALLLRLPNRTEIIQETFINDRDDSSEVGAPVTPALLLLLPNRANDNEMAAPVTLELFLRLGNRADMSEESISGGQDEADEVAAPVTPALLLRLPNRVNIIHESASGDREHTNQVLAPVTPALLLRLPNRAGEIQIEDIEGLNVNQTIDISVGEENVVDDSSTSAETSRRTSGATSQSTTTTNATDLGDSEPRSTSNSVLTSMLRRHRFFSVEPPTTSNLNIFPAQTAMQAELDNVITTLPGATADEDSDFTANSGSSARLMTA